MPSFIASCFNPATGKTETSEVDALDAALIRARTLRGVQPFEQQPGCSVTVTEPNSTVWTLRPGNPPSWTEARVHKSAKATKAKRTTKQKKA